MTLSCGCHVGFDPSDLDEWWEYCPDGEDVFPAYRKRRARCKSCNALVGPGDDVLLFSRYRRAKNEIEERIHSDNPIDIAPLFHCGRCAEIFLSLAALGYCVQPEDNMEDSLREYWKMTGFDPEKYTTKPRGEV